MLGLYFIIFIDKKKGMVKKMKSVMETLLKYKQALEKDGYDVLYIALYGSQNYGVSDECSDVDAKAIVLPKIDDIVFKRNISFVREFDNGACDVKDLITFYNVVKKGNFSFLEPFHTPYFIGDVYLKCLFSSILTNQMSLLGGMYEKQKAFLHEYPSKKEEFSKFGCDPKQYHHIVRLYDIIKYAENKNTLNFPFLRYCGEGAEYMKKIKRGLNGLTVEQIQKDIEIRIEEAKTILDNKQYKFQEVNLEEEVGFYLKQKIREALLNEQI